MSGRDGRGRPIISSARRYAFHARAARVEKCARDANATGHGEERREKEREREKVRQGRIEETDVGRKEKERIEEGRDGSTLQRAFPISEPFKSDVDLWAFRSNEIPLSLSPSLSLRTSFADATRVTPRTLAALRGNAGQISG